MSTPVDWNKQIIDEFRANGGKVGGHFSGATLLILHTRGAKSGKERVNPVAYVKDGDRYVIVASKGGAPTNPDWYYNLLADPQVTIEVDSQQLQARASVVAEPDRTRLYQKMAAMLPSFNDYVTRTSRVIPVIALTPSK